MVQGPGIANPVVNVPVVDPVNQEEDQDARIKRIAGIVLVVVGLVFAAVAYVVTNDFFAIPNPVKLGLGITLVSSP
jgi:multisubunit Na+/H+ antiporter MnhB subunit